jgi:hypothetical protein
MERGLVGRELRVDLGIDARDVPGAGAISSSAARLACSTDMPATRARMKV